MFADGTFCRLIHATTLLQGAPNAVTLEFTTPRIAAAAPQGVLACLTSQGASFTSQSPLALRSGGTQFDMASTSARDAGFFDAPASAWGVDAVEQCTVYDVLSTDAFYADTFISTKFESLGSAAQRPKAAARGVDQGGNCALVTGSWVANERYELTLNATNAVETGTDFGVWIGMIEYGRSPGELTFVTRGPKHGTMCEPHARLGTAPLRVVNATQLASMPAWPSAPTTLPAVPTQPCRDGFAFSPRYDGECVSCGTRGAYSGAACICQANQLSLSAGPVACVNLTVAGAPTSLVGLPTALCTAFAAQKVLLDNGELSASLVTSSYVERFVDLAAPLMDVQDVLEANATYAATELYDDRRPTDPSRRTGVGPSCATCDVVNPDTDSRRRQWIVDPFGFFVDYKTGQASQVRDRKYLAAHIMRFLGYVLRMTTGQACPSLYVPGSKQDIYGTWTDNVCSS